MSIKESSERISPPGAVSAPAPMAAPATADKLHRSMSVWNSFTLGFAVVSPVVGLYAIIGVQTVVTGGGWFAALAIGLPWRFLLATVYAGLSPHFRFQGVVYNGPRHLGGPLAGHYPGVIYIC